MEIVLTGVLVVAMAYCALRAVLARRLILSALWLAGASALLSALFYLLGAYLIAVVELSVGAGLVTVLFAFAISLAGDELIPLRPLVPKVLGGLLTLAAVLLVGRLSLPGAPAPAAQLEPALPAVIWEQRGLDILVQIVLIFAGVLGLLGLLAEVKAPLRFPVAEAFAEKRERELEALHADTLEGEPDEELEKEPV